MLTKTQLFSKGFLAVAPHMFSVIPFGIICGATARKPFENSCFFVSIFNRGNYIIFFLNYIFKYQ